MQRNLPRPLGYVSLALRTLQGTVLFATNTSPVLRPSKSLLVDEVLRDED